MLSLQQMGVVQVHHPLQQGLRLVRCYMWMNALCVQVHHPLQQGLRHGCNAFVRSFF